jgi:predicted phosphoribosyltransferase
MSATSSAVFRDRSEAGRRLAVRLERLRHEAPVVLALPRGGVPVAAEVAAALAAPLDVIAVHKLGDPGGRFGAVAEDGVAVVDHDRALALGVDPARLSALREQAGVAAAESVRRLRAGGPPRDIVGRTVVLVDDGVGTGDAAIAAARTARRRGAARIVLAVPVASASAFARLGEELDEVVCVEIAPPARWYEHAPQVSDAAIIAALARAGHAQESLRVPEGARGAVVLATPIGPVRRTLAAMGYAILELQDDGTIDAALQRLRSTPATKGLPIGCFGLGDAAETALDAAAANDVRAVVAAGGRPDRAGSSLPSVTAATLLVVGGEDRHVLRLAREIGTRVTGDHGLAVVPGADHDFTQPGALEQVAHHTGAWFARHLQIRPRTPAGSEPAR